MSVAAIIVLALMLVALGISLGKHGQPRPAYNFWVTLIDTAITLALLWWGGFFSAK